jgi:predicted transcriptional regulator
VASELMTIRLDAALRSRLRAVAARRSLTPSAAVRLAVESWLAAEDARADSQPYERLADLIGRVATTRPPGPHGPRGAKARPGRRAPRGAGR